MPGVRASYFSLPFQKETRKEKEIRPLMTSQHISSKCPALRASVERTRNTVLVDCGTGIRPSGAGPKIYALLIGPKRAHHPFSPGPFAQLKESYLVLICPTVAPSTAVETWELQSSRSGWSILDTYTLETVQR